MRDLGTLPGDGASVGTGINDSGAVVGASIDGEGNPRGYVWQNGTMTDLNTLISAAAPLYVLFAGSDQFAWRDRRLWRYRHGRSSRFSRDAENRRRRGRRTFACRASRGRWRRPGCSPRHGATPGSAVTALRQIRRSTHRTALALHRKLQPDTSPCSPRCPVAAPDGEQVAAIQAECAWAPKGALHPQRFVRGVSLGEPRTGLSRICADYSLTRQRLQIHVDGLSPCRRSACGAAERSQVVSPYPSITPQIQVWRGLMLRRKVGDAYPTIQTKQAHSENRILRADERGV
jgi:probable HAF family extracellular repeat protein